MTAPTTALFVFVTVAYVTTTSAFTLRTNQDVDIDSLIQALLRNPDASRDTLRELAMTTHMAPVGDEEKVLETTTSSLPGNEEIVGRVQDESLATGVRARGARSASAQCAEPSEEELRSQLDGDTALSAPVESTDRIGHRYGSCPNSFLVTSSRSVENRALCSWTEEIHSDINRYPRDVTYAKCACRRCKEPNQSAYMRSSFLIGCRPVTRSQVVLKRGECVDGVYRYHATKLSVPVACVCAKHRII